MKCRSIFRLLITIALDYVLTTAVDALAQKNSRDYSSLANAARSAAIIRSSQNMTVSVRKRTGTRLSKDINETADFSFVEELPESMEAKKEAILPWPTCTYDLYDTKCGFGAGPFKQFKWVPAVSTCVYFRKWSVNWWKAITWCREQNDRKDIPRDIELATPTTRNVFLHYLDGVRRWRLWTGYDDHNREGCFTSVRREKKKRRGKCIPWDSWFWDEPPNDDGGQDCAALGDDTGYHLDDDDCSKTYPYVCTEIISDRLFMKEAKVDWSGLPSYVIVGDMFTFTFRLSIRGGQNVYILLKVPYTIYDWEISVDSTHHNNSINLLLPRESQRVLHWTYDHEHKYRRCNALVTIEVSLMARKASKDDFYIVYKPNNASTNISRIFRPSRNIFFTVGHYFATLIKPQDDRLTVGREYTFKCMARLGNHGNTTAQLSILNMKRSDNVEYKADGVESWVRIYHFQKCHEYIETGTLPSNVQLRDVKCEDEDAMGGYHINMTFHIHGLIGSLHLRTILCQGNTQNHFQGEHVGREQNSVTHEINIRFPPGTPELKIISDYPDGVVIAGAKIRAECTAYIGTVSYPQEITWLIYTVNQTAPRDKWTVHYPQANNLHIPGKTFSGRPGAIDCPDWKYERKGKCVKIVKDLALSWDDAQAYCIEHLKWGLLIIDDNTEYNEILEKLGGDGYWIGLNTRGNDGEYRWHDGTYGAPRFFGGYWWDPDKHAEESQTGESFDKCVLLHRGGLEDFDCQRKMHFICQSQTFSVPSFANFDLDLGPRWTSIVEIDVNDFDWIQDTQLQCKTQRDSTVDDVMKEKGITEFSNRTAPFRYVYFPSKPKIEVIEQVIDGEFYINLTCSSVVGMSLDGGMMTLAIRYSDEKATSFWRVKSEGKIAETDGNTKVLVESIYDEEDKNSGRYMKSNMLIKIHRDFQNCMVECYSYDYGTRIGWGLSKDSLKDEYYMNLRFLKKFNYWQLEEKLGANFLRGEEDTFRNDGGKYLAKGILIAILGSIILLMLWRKNEMTTRMKEVNVEETDGEEVEYESTSWI